LGLITFLRCPTVGVYFELKNAEKLAKAKGEPFNEKEWLKSHGYKGGLAGMAQAEAIKERLF
jgi:hypothetical protein